MCSIDAYLGNDIYTCKRGVRHYMPNTVAAVVVTYNRKELLRKCLNAIIGQKNVTCDIYVIDNNSDDGTKDMIISEYNIPNVKYHNTGKNLGGAGGFEIGVRMAKDAGYDYIWIMDDDTIPNDDALYELFEADKKMNGNWGFLSSVAYWTDGNICKMNIQKKTIFKHVGKKEYSKDISPIVMCSFVSLLVKGNVARKLGSPIGEYFIWTDDYEYTGRISREYPCYMVPNSKVTHAMKKHMRVDFANETPDRIERYHYIYRNDVHCYKKYGIKGWLYIILKDLYTSAKIIFKSKDNKLNKVKIVWKGFNEGLKFHPHELANN